MWSCESLVSELSFWLLVLFNSNFEFEFWLWCSWSFHFGVFQEVTNSFFAFTFPTDSKKSRLIWCLGSFFGLSIKMVQWFKLFLLNPFSKSCYELLYLLSFASLLNLFLFLVISRSHWFLFSPFQFSGSLLLGQGFVPLGATNFFFNSFFWSFHLICFISSRHSSCAQAVFSQGLVGVILFFHICFLNILTTVTAFYGWLLLFTVLLSYWNIYTEVWRSLIFWWEETHSCTSIILVPTPLHALSLVNEYLRWPWSRLWPCKLQKVGRATRIPSSVVYSTVWWQP